MSPIIHRRTALPIQGMTAKPLLFQDDLDSPKEEDLSICASL